ncbi:MAG: hypothetical protein NTNFB02_14930 [Nitrospira sp.]
MTLEFETGYRFTKDWGVWLRPEVGLWGQSLPGAYDLEYRSRHPAHVRMVLRPFTTSKPGVKDSSITARLRIEWPFRTNTR